MLFLMLPFEEDEEFSRIAFANLFVRDIVGLFDTPLNGPKPVITKWHVLRPCLSSLSSIAAAVDAVAIIISRPAVSTI